MKNKTTVTYLVVAGLLLHVIGGSILLAPHAFHGNNGIDLGDNPDLLSEIRAPGGLLASSGIAILIGAFRRRMRLPSLQLATLVYGSYGIARLVSMMLDGMPSASIVSATLLEFIVAIVGAAILWQQRAIRVAAPQRSRKASHAAHS